MFDILCTADDIASTLSQQTTLFIMSHPLHTSHRHSWPEETAAAASHLGKAQTFSEIQHILAATSQA